MSRSGIVLALQFCVYCPGSFAGFGHFSECIWPFYDLDSFGRMHRALLRDLGPFCRRRRARLQEIRALLQITQGSLALHFE